MKDKLLKIQSMLKSTARLALKSEYNIDVEVRCDQWNSWTQSDVESNMEMISMYVEDIQQLLKELKESK